MRPHHSATRTGVGFRQSMRRNAPGLVIARLPMFVQGINLERHAIRDRLCRLPNGQD